MQGRSRAVGRASAWMREGSARGAVITSFLNLSTIWHGLTIGSFLYWFRYRMYYLLCVKKTTFYAQAVF